MFSLELKFLLPDQKRRREFIEMIREFIDMSSDFIEMFSPILKKKSLYDEMCRPILHTHGSWTI